MTKTLAKEATRFDAPARSKPGGIYCAPWCDIGCTRASHDRAVKEAALLAERLGDGWQPEVFENFGWHWSAVKGNASVSPSRDGSAIDGDYVVTGYMCFFNTHPQVVTDAKSPEDALGFALQEARTIAQRIAADCNALSD